MPPKESDPLVKPDAAEQSKKVFNTILACGMFMTCSAAMMLVNKYVVKRFESPLTILELQLMFTVAVLGCFFFWTLHFGSTRDVWRWVSIVPILYAGMLTSSMIAQLYASVGLQVIIRNLGPLVTLPIERVFNEPIVADFHTWAALVLILIGIVLYAWQSLEKNASDMLNFFLGVILMLINLVVAMFERLFQRKLIAVEPVDISKTGMLLLNNVGAILPVMVLYAIPPLNEFDKWKSEWPKATAVDYVMLVLSGVCGVAIGWTAINAQGYVTATTMLVITNLNKVVVVTIGILFMGEIHTPLAVGGIALSLCGGVYYALARQNAAKVQKEKEKAAKETDEKNLAKP